jgi:IclR family transcriptional regulator, acetate operon repressor
MRRLEIVRTLLAANNRPHDTQQCDCRRPQSPPRFKLPAPTRTATATYQTRSLIRALDILESFSLDCATLSVKDLSTSLAIPKPTVSRLASALEDRGFLRRAGRAYQLGPKAFELGAVFAKHAAVNDGARKLLTELAEESLQTACIGVRSRLTVVHIMVATPPRPVYHVTEVGGLSLAHATGIGKAVLARLSDDELDPLLATGSLVRLTENTICEPDALREELNATRTRGYALDNEETSPGLRCVGIAIELPNLGITGMSVSGPAGDYTPAATRRFAKLLAKTADRLPGAFLNAD